MCRISHESNVNKNSFFFYGVLEILVVLYSSLLNLSPFTHSFSGVDEKTQG